MLQHNCVNTYDSIKKPTVVSTTSISNWLKSISNSEYSETITKARTGELDYDKTKASLPCVTYNFLYNNYKKDKNVISGTGYLYIDIDDKTFDANLLDSSMVYAYYKSFGGKGYAIIVKVDGLTLENFKSSYNFITEQLGIVSYVDVNAIKASQFNVLSFDKDIFINENSITFQAINKKVSFTPLQEREKRERLITVNDTFLKSEKVRFNNIDDYFKGTDGDYIVFDEKKNLCIPFIPKRIEVGQRNRTMFGVISQYALLNPTKEIGFLMSCANEINKHFTQKYEEEKIKSIVAGVIKKRKEGTLELFLNRERRILFNPNKKITKEEKQKTTAVLMGKIKTDKTQKSINDSIEDWNFQSDGKITQEKITKKLNKSLATIKRNWSPFKELVSELNNSSKEDSPEVLKIESKTVIDKQVENIQSLTPNHKELITKHVPTIVNSTISVERFIYNCKYKFGSYVADKRFDTLKKDLEEIWNLKFMNEVTEEIRNYINMQIDYLHEDGYYVKLQLLK